MGIDHPELTQREYEVRCEWGQCDVSDTGPMLRDGVYRRG